MNRSGRRRGSGWKFVCFVASEPLQFPSVRRNMFPRCHEWEAAQRNAPLWSYQQRWGRRALCRIMCLQDGGVCVSWPPPQTFLLSSFVEVVHPFRQQSICSSTLFIFICPPPTPRVACFSFTSASVILAVPVWWHTLLQRSSSSFTGVELHVMVHLLRDKDLKVGPPGSGGWYAFLLDHLMLGNDGVKAVLYI